MKKAVMLALALTLVSAATLYAHDTWVARDGGTYVVMWGHDGKSDPYKADFIKAAKGIDASGKDLSVMVKDKGTSATLVMPQEPALVIVVFNSGPWVKTPEGWKNVSKRGVKDVLQSIKGETFSKNLWEWNNSFTQPVGGKMELVPLKNPLALKVGDKLPFQVLYDGRPLPGATVGAEGVEKDSLKTDKDGKAEVVIKKNGLNIVKATRKTDTPNDPDADMLYKSATIAFEVK
ncbi:DUF4198 domain-containing protein [Desulfobacca acetoxidans]|uniref:Nickel transport complex protein, NikM subunit, transmembrane n=1 Tax=Desulfobacca acetoxidans (strain ATCC 700848 / DSM 11109 / ASRB2) TaxID=880072 RepID=F2NK11_DESAR|nr:DUF4198 domain-containing protein [Desulfobacca acetoxidans]AEB09955.1 Nickel transport complex protein, NikM subunit, transmembrane [Desulfobacca acetoxidans DSM 11109]